MAEILCNSTLRNFDLNALHLWIKMFEGSVGDDGDILHNYCSINKFLNIFNEILRACNEI
jgi:hypothetical protein